MVFIRRIGEPLMNEFNYKNENYEDLTRSKNHLSKFNSTIEFSDFYIGSAGSHAEAVEYLIKKMFG